MPIYEYQCTACGKKLDAFQRISENPLTTCPDCEGETLQRMLFSAPSFQLKGTGWYKTDYTDYGKQVKEGESAGDSEKTSDNKNDKGTTESTKDKPEANSKKASDS